MNSYKALFADYSSEVLLEKRALGDELADEAHAAIEEIFNERGERLPPKPSKPIIFDTPETKGDRRLKLLGIFAFVFAMMTLAGAITHSWIVYPVAIFLFGYVVFKSAWKDSLSPEAMEDVKAKEDGLTEIMVSAARGDILRVKELVAFGIDVNSQSKVGTSALMYAAKNNHLPVVEFLLSAGAIVGAKSDKGSSALSLAEQSGHVELVTFLRLHGAQ